MKNSIRFMYVRDSEWNPIGCLAITVDRKRNRAQYGLSMRNPKDASDKDGRRVRFDRDYAQQMALVNLAADPDVKRAYIAKEANMHQITSAVMMDIVARGTAPSGAMKHAKRWLEDSTYLTFLQERHVL